MKYYILYNPHSGNGGSQARAEELQIKYGNAIVEDITTIASYKEFFAPLTEDDAVVICGGDGTLYRFVNDTHDVDYKCDVLLAAAGTGNDFLTDLGKTKEDEPFSIRDYIHDLPTVTVNGHTSYFLNAIGFGIDGYCCEEGDRVKAANPGKPVNYAGIAIKGMLGKFKPADAKVTVDGVEYNFKKVWLAPTMHGKYYGGGMKCAPDQDRLAEDKMNTLVVWHGCSALKALIHFSSIFKGEHIKRTEMIKVFRGHEITVEFAHPTALQIDGETVSGVTVYSTKSAK